MLEKENRMFEIFLKRLDPKDMQLKSNHLSSHNNIFSMCSYVMYPATHSSQLDMQRKKVRIREGDGSSVRYVHFNTCTLACN